MERILIFGDTPMAKRLDFYLVGYAASKQIPINVVRTSNPKRMKDVQASVWERYVGALSGRPDLIINAHEYRSINGCETNVEKAWFDNTLIASHIMYAARSASVPLIQLSSDHVFRGDRGPYREDAEPNPINMYGVSKWYAEMAAQQIYPKREALGTTIVRTSGLYGWDEDTPPAASMRSEGGAIVRGEQRLSPSFIGEVAFLLARNILLAPMALHYPYIHIASGDAPVRWADFLLAAGATVVSALKTGTDVAKEGMERGLVPSRGWFLSTGAPKKAFEDFQEEYKAIRQQGSERPAEHGYVRYWNSG